MKDKSDRKYIFFTHIYAGARQRHDTSTETEYLWKEDYNERYFKMLKPNQDKLIIEVAGHDHWEDLRAYNNKKDG